MISHYLIDVVEPESKDRFRELVKQYTESKHVLSEGVSCFLFLYVKESANRHVNDMLRPMDWYKNAFLNYIWEVSENRVEDRDIDDISLYLAEKPDLAPLLVYNDRWRVQRHRINISILLDLLSRYDDEQLIKYIEKAWPNSKTWSQRESAREHLLNQTQKIIEHNDFQDIDIHTIFEHLLYFAPFCRMAKSIYNQYYERVRPEKQIRRVYEHTHSSQLKAYIEQL